MLKSIFVAIVTCCIFILLSSNVWANANHSGVVFIDTPWGDGGLEGAVMELPGISSSWQVEELHITANANMTKEDMSWVEKLSHLQVLNVSESVHIDSVSKYFFYNNRRLKKVILPLRHIDGYAFYGCEALTDVSLPQLVSVGENAFGYCPLLKKVNLPNLETVGWSAFGSCGSLTGIHLPKLQSIGRSAFANCQSLVSVTLPKLTTIGSNAFNCSKALKDVELPELVSIGGNAFSDCDSLVSISLPKLKVIGGDAFSDNDVLVGITLPRLEEIGSSAFRGCDSLVSITLSRLKVIGGGALCYCNALNEVIFPALTSIGQKEAGYAFAGSNGLNNIVVPSLTVFDSFLLPIHSRGRVVASPTLKEHLITHYSDKYHNGKIVWSWKDEWQGDTFFHTPEKWTSIVLKNNTLPPALLLLLDAQ